MPAVTEKAHDATRIPFTPGTVAAAPRTDVKTCFVAGLTHIDLAWLYPSAHYRVCQENATVRLLDILEQDPEFTYCIEQMLHYRWQHETRPDLARRMRTFVQQGRLEVVGGMASSLDPNGPNGECYVRNHLIGRAWAREHLGADVKVGSLIDTFGHNAQTPQIHKQLGMDCLFANRVSGNVYESLFYSRGIDGTTITMASPSGHPPAQRPGRVHFSFLQGRAEKCDALFGNVDASGINGPHLMVPYDECEQVPTHRSRQQIDEKNNTGCSDAFRYGTMARFFNAVKESGMPLTSFNADMAAVLTGCYGLRPFVRMRNRTIETQVMEAEKWGVLTGNNTAAPSLKEAWWNLAYIQSHDIYSGSFPHGPVRDEVTAYLNDTERLAALSLNRVLGPAAITAHGNTATLSVYNGLPWQRSDTVQVPLPEGWDGITNASCGSRDVDVQVTGRTVTVRAEVPATGMDTVTLTRGATAATEATPADRAVLENEYLYVECSAENGIEKIINKETGTVVAAHCGGLITAQHDTGFYQREEPAGGEVPAATGNMSLEKNRDSSLTLRGSFLPLRWAGPENHLDWELHLSLLPGKPRLDIGVKINWKGEASRIRLCLPTTMNTSESIQEIPFGTVKRKPYGVGDAARNDYPVHRFVAMENGCEGVALINNGPIGAETMGGNIWSILFRAPAKDWNKLVRDATSSQHGTHEFRFAITAYSGTLADSPVFSMAQEVNNPLLARAAGTDAVAPGTSLLGLTPSSCVLSCVKAPEDGSDDIIVRFYESGGRDDTAILAVPGMTAAYTSDMLENNGRALTVENDTVRVAVKPFEIMTVRVIK